MQLQAKHLRYIYFFYWFLLAYILAALTWWFIALNNQNHQMANYKLNELNPNSAQYEDYASKIMDAEKRKTTQYLGEGSIFFLLIMAGAVFIFGAVRNQLKQSQNQQHFMMAITHELKTPIAVAKLNLETLQKRKLDEEQQKKLIQNTLQEANRLNALCNNLLLSSQMEAGGYKLNMEETDFSELVNQCIHDFIVRFPQRIIQATIQKEVYVMGDLLLLQMAINNLIDNALKYAPKELPIAIHLSEVHGKISLSVIDEGKGIAAEEKAKVFHKFYRIGNASTKSAKGTGLGLYLTKKIVAQHKGKIYLTDNQPKGSIFAIQLNTANAS